MGIQEGQCGRLRGVLGGQNLGDGSVRGRTMGVCYLGGGTVTGSCLGRGGVWGGVVGCRAVWGGAVVVAGVGEQSCSLLRPALLFLQHLEQDTWRRVKATP